jgi:hypothetical protein
MALLLVDDRLGAIYSAPLRPVAYQVDFDPTSPGLTSLCHATTQRPCLIQVYTALFVNCYDLLKVGTLLQPCWGLGHATVAPGA